MSSSTVNWVKTVRLTSIIFSCNCQAKTAREHQRRSTGKIWSQSHVKRSCNGIDWNRNKLDVTRSTLSMKWRIISCRTMLTLFELLELPSFAVNFYKQKWKENLRVLFVNLVKAWKRVERILHSHVSAICFSWFILVLIKLQWHFVSPIACHNSIPRERAPQGKNLTVISINI